MKKKMIADIERRVNEKLAAIRNSVDGTYFKSHHPADPKAKPAETDLFDTPSNPAGAKDSKGNTKMDDDMDSYLAPFAGVGQKSSIKGK
jgi:hypothetical protein